MKQFEILYLKTAEPQFKSVYDVYLFFKLSEFQFYYPVLKDVSSFILN